MQLRQLLNSIAHIGGMKPTSVSGPTNVDVANIVYDSRQVVQGSVFVAIPGNIVDGHDYIDAAIGAGSCCIVCERPPTTVRHAADVCVIEVAHARAALAVLASCFYGDPSRELNIVGITGTNGKTTQTYLLEAIFKAAGLSAGVLGTVNYRFNDYVQVAKRTTPESVDLMKLLRQMVDGGVSHVAMEVSSHALMQKRVDQCQFAATMLTNITQDHLDYHASLDDYQRAKEQLFLQAEAQTTERKPCAIVNADDANSQTIIARLNARQRSKVLSFSLFDNKQADYVVRNLELGRDGFVAEIQGPEVDKTGKARLQSKLTGRHNVSNCLAAVAAALSLGIEWQAIAQGIAQLATIPGRLQRVDTDRDVAVFVDYAHTDDALHNVLSALQELRQNKGRIITVFGCGGDRDRAKRPLMGKAAINNSDVVLVTSDNPRSEDPQTIIHDILADTQMQKALTDIDKLHGETTSPTCATIVDRRQAIDTALTIAKPGDMVLVAGKGHEDYQEIKGTYHNFSDYEEVLRAVRSLGWKQISA